MLKIVLLFAFTVVTGSFSYAQEFDAAAAQQLPKVKAVIRRIAADNSEITLKHEDIPNLGMPGMTMPFVVPNPQMIQGFNAGEKVLFTADMINNELTLMWIERR